MSFTITIAHSWCIRCKFKTELILNIFHPATRLITATRSGNLGQRLIAQPAKFQFCTIQKTPVESQCVTTNMRSSPNLTLHLAFGLERYLLPLQRLNWTYYPVSLDSYHKLFLYIIFLSSEPICVRLKFEMFAFQANWKRHCQASQ